MATFIDWIACVDSILLDERGLRAVDLGPNPWADWYLAKKSPARAAGMALDAEDETAA